MGVLTVFLDRAENLVNRDLGTCSDPYVKFELEQDNWVRALLARDFSVPMCPFSNCFLSVMLGVDQGH